MRNEIDAEARGAIARLRELRAVSEALSKREDAAFERYFLKRQSGVRTNGAAVSRLMNQAAYLSADLAVAEDAVWKLCDRYGWRNLDEAVNVETQENEEHQR